MLGLAWNHLVSILPCWLCVCEHIFPSLWVLDCSSVKWERLGPMVCLEGSFWSGSLGQLRAKALAVVVRTFNFCTVLISSAKHGKQIEQNRSGFQNQSFGIFCIRVSSQRRCKKALRRKDSWFVCSYEEIQLCGCPSTSAWQRTETLPTQLLGPTSNLAVCLCLCCQANGLVCQAGMQNHVWRAPRPLWEPVHVS